MGFSILHRNFARFGLLSLLLLGCGCSESTDPVDIVNEAPVTLNPREVPSVEVGHGPEPGEVEVSWRIVSWATFPIVEYQVGMSFEGPVTEDTWDQAVILGRHPWRKGQIKFREVYGSDEGLFQGAHAWFSVRALDEMGNLSRLKESPQMTLSGVFWIEGHVYDFLGNPVQEMPITCSWPARTTSTDATGFFRIGPFRNIDQIELVTGAVQTGDLAGSWYVFNREPLRSLPGQTLVADVDFFLIPHLLLDPRCPVPDNEFLTFLRTLTDTGVRDNDPDISILHRWEHYPLTVFIPPFVNETGVLMHEAVLPALFIWNGVMGEEYFVPTDDQESANIEFRFEHRVNFYGYVSLLSPAGPGAELGRVIPKKMGVLINPSLSTTKLVTEVSLHELGHTLGLYIHSNCKEAGYLMDLDGGFGVLDKPEPIHLDERRAVECVRYLPQGQDMARYRLD